MAERLRLQVVLDAVENVSGPLKRIMSGAGGATAALKATSAELAGMKRLSGDITNYQRLRAELRGVSQTMDEARTRTAAASATATQLRADHHALAGEVRAARAVMKMHSAELANAKEPSAALTTAYNVQKTKLAELEQRYSKSATSLRTANRAVREGEQSTARLTQREQALSGQLEQTRQKLDKAGVSAAQMAGRQRALRSEVAQTTNRLDQQRKQLERLQVIQQRAKAMHGAGMTASLHGAGFMLAGQRALTGAAAPLGASMEFESGMADVRKVVDDLQGENNPLFKEMSRDIQNLSLRLPMAAGEMTKLVAAAGQANIARQELLHFTEDATKMGVAFDTTADDAGQTMATWRTAFRLTQDEVVELADQINYLGNTGPAKVDKIAGVVNRIGALGEVAGLQAGAVAALGATVAGMGIQEEVAATGIKNLLLRLTAGAAATKQQRAAFQVLRLDSVKLAKSMQMDANGTILDVLERIKNLPKFQQNSILKQIFGTESVGALAPLLTNTDLLATNFKKVGDRAIYAGSMQQEYLSRVATSENSLQLLKNSANVLAITIGDTLIPDFKVLAERAGIVVKRVVDWMRAHPQLTAMLAKSAIVGAALVTVIGGLLTVGGMAAMGFSQIYKAVGLVANGGALSGVTRMFGQLVRLLPTVANGARMLLPVLGGISWPVLAIGAAVAVVAALVWRYWQPIKAFAVGVWQGVAATGGKALTELSAALAPLAPAWATLTGWVGAAWDWFSKLLAPVASTSEELQNATSYGRMFGEAILGNLRLVIAGVGWVVTGFSWLGQTIGNTIGFVVTGLGHMWDAITGLFRGDWSQVVAALRGGWANVDMFLGGLPARFMEWGAEMIQGLVNGIVSRVPLIGDALKNGITAPVTWFKDFLGIKSPSRLFAEFGGFTMQGYAMGLNREGNAPLQAIAGVSQRVRAAGAGIMLAASVPAVSLATPHAGQSVAEPATPLQQIIAAPPIIQAAPAVASLPAVQSGDTHATPLQQIIAAPPIIQAAPAVASLPAVQSGDTHATPLQQIITAPPVIKVAAPIVMQPQMQIAEGRNGHPRASATPAAGDNISIYVTGQDPQAIARAVAAELDRRDRARQARTRSRLSDTD